MHNCLTIHTHVVMIKDKDKQEEYRLALKNRFQVLQELLEEETIDEQWRKVKESVTTTCREVLGHKKYSHKEWITQGTLEKVAERRGRQQLTSAAQEQRGPVLRRHTQQPTEVQRTALEPTRGNISRHLRRRQRRPTTERRPPARSRLPRIRTGGCQ